MPNETRDPELEWVRSYWEPPPPTRGFHDRVLAAFVHKAGSAPPWLCWLAIRVPLPVAAAAVFAAFILAWFTSPYFRNAQPQTSARQATTTEYHYRPVSEPRFIVITQGEHP